MNNSVGGSHVSQNNSRFACRRLDLDVVVSPDNGDVFPADGGYSGDSVRDGRGGNLVGEDVSQENGLEVIGLGKETVESISRDLGKSIIGGSKHGESSRSGQSLSKTSSFHSSQQGAESLVSSCDLSNAHCGSSLWLRCRSGAIVMSSI